MQVVIISALLIAKLEEAFHGMNCKAMQPHESDLGTGSFASVCLRSKEVIEMMNNNRPQQQHPRNGMALRCTTRRGVHIKP